MWQDYIEIHRFLDHSKESFGDFRHRALYHHTEGIALCERLFGVTLVTSDGKEIPTRWIAEQHVIEDFGRIPNAAEFLSRIQPESWMSFSARKLSKELEDEPWKQTGDNSSTT